jgi:hypothetical protein
MSTSGQLSAGVGAIKEKGVRCGQRIERSEVGALGELLSTNFENVCFCWTSQSAQLMSAFAGKADIAQTPSDVCF